MTSLVLDDRLTLDEVLEHGWIKYPLSTPRDLTVAEPNEKLIKFINDIFMSNDHWRQLAVRLAHAYGPLEDAYVMELIACSAICLADKTVPFDVATGITGVSVDEIHYFMTEIAYMAYR